jgi:glycerol-3-phosphate O-acyltransferase
MAAEIRQMLIESIDSQKRVILGPIMKSRQQFKEIVLMDRRVSERIVGMAAGDKKKLRELRKKAGEYFDEIAADYNITYIQFFQLALNWFWKRIFDGVDVDMAALGKVREWARKGTLIYVPSHKSHIDYLILNYVLYVNHMHIPRVAAGKNLAFWPFGHIFRKSGAFFIRRSFSRESLYLEVFNRYIKALLEEGHPIEFFIEGGRSRNGKLVLPKTGFLSILLQAYREGFCKDLVFVPTSIVYDRIIEESSYVKEMGGGVKEKETFKQFLNARRFLKKRYGKIHIRFNEAFSLREYLSQSGLPEQNSHRHLAFHLVQAINAVSLVIPLSLVATAILAEHRRGFHRAALAETVDTLLEFLRRHDVPLAENLHEPSKAIQDTLSLLIGWKIVDFLEDTGGVDETFYYVDEDKKVELEYYKNNILHFFISHAFVAISLLTGTEDIKEMASIISDYAFLKDLFKNEFVFDEEEDLSEKVAALAEYFVETALLSRSENGGYRVTKLGFDKLPIWAALIKTFLESYWIAVKSVSQQQDKKGGREDLLKRMNYVGKRFYKMGLIDHIGALSQLNFKNALSLIDETIIREPEISKESSDVSERLSQLGQKLYDLSHYRS